MAAGIAGFVPGGMNACDSSVGQCQQTRGSSLGGEKGGVPRTSPSPLQNLGAFAHIRVSIGALLQRGSQGHNPVGKPLAKRVFHLQQRGSKGERVGHTRQRRTPFRVK